MWNAEPPQPFLCIEAVEMRQGVEPVNAGDCIFHLEIVKPACRQNEPLVSKPPRQFHACRVDIAESQPKSQASGS